MEQMDLICPQTVQNKILQKCRETNSPSSSLFQIWIIFDRFEVIVKNLSQPLNFRANFSLRLLSPQDDARIILKLPDYSNLFLYYILDSNYTRIYNSWKCCENRSSSFWAWTVNKKINRRKTIIGHRCYAKVPIKISIIIHILKITLEIHPPKKSPPLTRWPGSATGLIGPKSVVLTRHPGMTFEQVTVRPKRRKEVKSTGTKMRRRVGITNPTCRRV